MDLPCKQDPLPFLPLQIEESLHGELSRVGARHGGGLQVTHVFTLLRAVSAHLARSQDANGPDVHGHSPVLATEEDPALVDVSRHSLVVGGEGGIVTQDAIGGVLTQGPGNRRVSMILISKMIPDLISLFVFPFRPLAKTATTNTFITKLIKSAMAASMK